MTDITRADGVEAVASERPRYGLKQLAFDRIADGLNEMARLLVDEPELGDLARRLSDRAEQVRNGSFTILVIGDFSRGKSTLLNAMLGDTVLFQKAAECTPVVTLIRYGEPPAVTVEFVDQRPSERLDIQTFRDRYQLQVDDSDDREAAMDRFSAVDRAVVGYPCELLRHRVELVDSPGLGAHKIRAQRTQKYIERADAILFVLHAQQFLNKDESHLIDNILLPAGLRNIFFAINFFNLLRDSALREEDFERDVAELDQAIRLRLSPLCQVDGQDRTSERVFRVNALGALRARLRQPPPVDVLEASEIPALEQAIERFLIEDRTRAINDVTRGLLHGTAREIEEITNMRLALAAKTVEELERERQAIQPKLDRLRGIRKHTDGYLQTQAANLKDRLAISLQNTIRGIVKRLDEEVAKFDYGGLKRTFMVWRALTDWARDDENKFAKQVERQLTPQVQKLLERELSQWQRSVVHNELSAVAIDVEKHLQEEADEYYRVLREIEEQLGVKGQTLQVKELVARWVGSAETGGASAGVAFAGVGLVGAAGWLLGSFAMDFVSDIFTGGAVAAGTTGAASGGLLVVAPWLVGALAVLKLGVREVSMHREFEKKIAQGLRERLQEMESSRVTELRSRIGEDFDLLRERITGAISEQITAIETLFESIIERKRNAKAQADREETRLKQLRSDLDRVSQVILEAM